MAVARLIATLAALTLGTAAAVAPAADPWLTRMEVADRIRVPRKTLAQWAHQGKGPKYARFGRHCRYRLSDVIDWESKQFSGEAV